MRLDERAAIDDVRCYLAFTDIPDLNASFENNFKAKQLLDELVGRPVPEEKRFRIDLQMQKWAESRIEWHPPRESA